MAPASTWKNGIVAAANKEGNERTGHKLRPRAPVIGKTARSIIFSYFLPTLRPKTHSKGCVKVTTSRVSYNYLIEISYTNECGIPVAVKPLSAFGHFKRLRTSWCEVHLSNPLDQNSVCPVESRALNPPTKATDRESCKNYRQLLCRL